MEKLDAAKAEEIFESHQLHGLKKLLLFSSKRNLEEIGSSSFAPKYATDLGKVIEITFKNTGVYPRGLSNMILWRRLGDPSGMFYFGGYKSNLDRPNDAAIAINVTTHLCYLAALVDIFSAFTPNPLLKLDALAGSLADMQKTVEEKMRGLGAEEKN